MTATASLTQMQLLGIGSETNVAEGYPRFAPTPSQAAILARLPELMTEATSLGGVETTLERRQKYVGDAHVAPGLIRMSVGIEHVDDLWDDLQAALGSAASLHS